MPASKTIDGRQILAGAVTPVTVVDPIIAITDPVVVESVTDPVTIVQPITVQGTVIIDPASTSSVRFIDENGTAYGIEHVNNKPRVSSIPYLFDIAGGNIADHEPISRYGHNEDVGTAWETVHDASTLRHYLAAAERLQVASTDADDDGAPIGNGARTVMITGLDSNYDFITETVTMNGVANVLTDASFLRVLQMNVVTAGATGYNEGTITASNNADTVVLDQMGPQENQSHYAGYTVPNGYTAYIVQAMATEGSNKGSQFGLWARLFGGVWTMQRTVVLIQSSIVQSMQLPIRIPAKTDIEVRARGILAGANVTAGFDGWVET